MQKPISGGQNPVIGAFGNRRRPMPSQRVICSARSADGISGNSGW